MSYYTTLDTPPIRSFRGFGDAAPPPATPPPESHPIPTWAVVGIVGGILVVAGAALYFRYKMMSQIVHEQGVGKALAFEAGEAAIGAVGRRL